MPLEPFQNAPRQLGQLISRRGMLQAAGILPLLALRGSARERIQDGGPRAALALQLEGAETSFHGTAVSPDGSTAYVAFSEPDSVLVVDLRAGRLRSAIDLTPAGVMLGSAQAVLSADGKLLFVANQAIGNIRQAVVAQGLRDPRLQKRLWKRIELREDFEVLSSG